MKAYHILFVVLVLATTSYVAAGDIALSPELGAKAFIVKADKNGLWEKTLFVQFPQKRRVLSTNDGLVDVVAVVNHAAHSGLWDCSTDTRKPGQPCPAMVYLQKSRERAAQRVGVQRCRHRRGGHGRRHGQSGRGDQDDRTIRRHRVGHGRRKGNAIRTGAEDATFVEPDPAFPNTVENRPPSRAQSMSSC